MLHKTGLPKETQEKLEKLCLNTALSKVFCNVGEEDWPENVLELLENGSAYDEKTKKEAIIWKPYEDYDTDDLLDKIEEEKESAWYLVMKTLETIGYRPKGV